MIDFDPEIIKRVIDKCPLVPRNDAVVVYKINLKETAGGILLPDKRNSNSSQGFAGAGVVIAAGPGRFIDMTGDREPVNLKPGDVVIFAALAGLQLGEVVRSEVGSEFSFEELVLIRANDLMFTLRDRNVIKHSERMHPDVCPDTGANHEWSDSARNTVVSCRACGKIRDVTKNYDKYTQGNE